MDIKVIVGSIVRHGVSALGALLVAKGLVDPSDVAGLVEAAVGFVLAVGTVGWSYYSRKK